MNRVAQRVGPPLLVLGWLSGCGQAALLDGRIVTAESIIEYAELRGAYQCAPRELALAKAHLAFARVELAQGDASRAASHLVLGEPNAKAAQSLSQLESCVVGGSEVRLASTQDADGDGVPDPRDACPDVPESWDGFEDGDGCPELQDTDGDGIPDAMDACPAEREDMDGYLDHDGCPELDNDLDGIPDERDRCPMEAEDRDGFQDEDGCPELDNDGDGIPDLLDQCPNEAGMQASLGCPQTYPHVEITRKSLRTLHPIQFEGDTAVLSAATHGILATVAQVLRDHPGISLEVQGHTDSQGDDAENLAFSQARADAVRDYLVDHGVLASRLTARGYGETRPIESNRTSRGRSLNRRIEFVRTDSMAVQDRAVGQ